MLTISIRSIIIYFIVLFCFRIMGKRQLGQIQPFELVLTLIIADLATLPIAEVSIPILHGIIPIFSLLIVHFLIAILCRCSLKFATLISGKSIVVVNENGIDLKALKNLAITVEDLMESLRGCGYFSLSDISFAIMETNGKLSVLPKQQCSPATQQQMKVKIEKTTLPIIIICEGRMVDRNLKTLNINKNKFKKYLEKQNIQEKKVVLLSLDSVGNMFLQQKNKKALSKKIDIKEFLC